MTQTSGPESFGANGGTDLSRTAEILIVDDDQALARLLHHHLGRRGYDKVAVETDPTRAIPAIFRQQPDLVLLDIYMPGVSGLEILATIRSDPVFANMPIIVLTADGDVETKIEALELGANEFLQKPINPAELIPRVHHVLANRAYQEQLRRYSRELELAVARRTEELEISRQELIRCLARAAEYRDDDTGHHVVRVGRYARVIAARLGYDPEQLDELELAAQLHDVGKIGIPDAVLLKPGRLTPEEYDVIQKHCGFGKKIVQQFGHDELAYIRQHAENGSKILDTGSSPIMALAKVIALTHHERWDGSGYPLGLAATDIPLEGRIVAVADVFDALSTKRCYKPSFPITKCFTILEEGRGQHFDPDVLDAFFAAREQIVRIQIAMADTD